MAMNITFLSFLTFAGVVRAVTLFHVRNPKVQGRTLTFPATAPTRVQFIGGIGIPVEDLNFESVTSGYVLKAEYFLPTRADEFHPTYLRPQTIHRRSFNVNSTRYTVSNITTGPLTNTAHSSSKQKSSTFSVNWQNKYKIASTYRWVIYQSAELIMNRAGLPGRACVLRCICEHASTPLQNKSGVFAEILHILLTPSSSNDDLRKFNNNDYVNAEKTGRNAECENTYSECHVSLIDKITTILS